jgi:hypothetical protein
LVKSALPLTYKYLLDENRLPITYKYVLGKICFASDFWDAKEVNVGTFGLGIIPPHISGHAFRPCFVSNSNNAEKRQHKSANTVDDRLYNV